MTRPGKGTLHVRRTANLSISRPPGSPYAVDPMLASGPTSVNDHAQASKKERQGWTAGWAGRTITCPRSNADPAREKQHEAFAMRPVGQAITALGVHHPQGSNRRVTAPFGAMSKCPEPVILRKADG